jgi:hypothetical protein
MLVKSVSKKIVNHKPKPEVDDMIKKMRKEDEKIVKGYFEFVEAEGGFFDFTYRIYPGDPIQHYTLVHGETCDLPIGVVKHLNGCKKKIRRYQNVEQPPTGAVRTPRTYETTSRVRFVPVDFI